MNKFLIYVPNVDVTPKTLDDVKKFAENNSKFRITNVELNNTLANVKTGDKIVTGKGNTLYVVDTISESRENWSNETETYVDNLTRSYGLKKMNITSVKQVISFDSWCKYVKPLVKSTTNNINIKMNTKEKSIGGSLKSTIMDKFLPVKIENAQIAFDGRFCVKTTEGYVTIDENNDLCEFGDISIDVPAFAIPKPISQLTVGDIIVRGNNKFFKVLKINGSDLNLLSYTGTKSTVHLAKNYFLKNTFVKVVASLYNFNNGGDNCSNILMMSLLDEDKTSDDKLALMMMMNQGSQNTNYNSIILYSLLNKEKKGMNNLFLAMMMMNPQNQGQNNMLPLLLLDNEGDNTENIALMMMMNQGGQNGMNNMLPLLLMKEKKGNMSDIALMMMMNQGGNMFGGIFGGNTPAATPENVEAAVPAENATDPFAGLDETN